MNEQETKRTIDEIIDVETGEIIKSVDFFKKPESEIIAFRRMLQEAIAVCLGLLVSGEIVKYRYDATIEGIVLK